MKKNILIAGPCAAESEVQLLNTAKQLLLESQRANIVIDFFRAGIWKPRSHPDSFSGWGEKALPWLQRVREEFNIPVCVEVATPEHVELCEKFGVDAYWLGARTTVNPFLVEDILRAIPNKSKTIMIKNPVMPDLATWQGAIERAYQAGFNSVWAIHRGFSSLQENVFRNAPSWEIPVALKLKFPTLPIICDPSHITGNRNYIAQIAQIALNYGCDGFMVEVHQDPQKALSDSTQQLTPKEFVQLVQGLLLRVDNNDWVESLLMIERSKIENVDCQIASLLVQRMQAIENIAKIKMDNNITLLQPNQWSRVVERYYRNALHDDIYKNFLDQYLNILHHYSLEKQQNILSQNSCNLYEN